MSLFRTVGRTTTAAIALTAAAIAVTTPAAAGPVATSSWRVSHAGATAAGTHTVQQDPLGTSQTRTLKGLIDPGTAAGCFHVTVLYGATNWESPKVCAGVTPRPFSTTFRTVQIVRPPATVRLCSGAVCGTPAPLW
jgi:hypothetical protein